MTYIYFGTIDQKNAQEFLRHESFSHVGEKTKEFILSNLGRIRVLDPMMHGGGKIMFEDQEVMGEYLKRQETDPSSFMFNCCYLYPDTNLIKWGLEQGFAFYEYGLEKLIARKMHEAIDHCLEKGAITESQVMTRLYWGEGSLETLLYYVEKFNIKKLASSFSLAEKYSVEDLKTLWDKKLITGKDIQYRSKEKFYKINKQRVAERKAAKDKAYWATLGIKF